MSHNSHHNAKKNTNKKDDNKDELSERSYVAAAHRDDRYEEDRQESLDKAKEIHLARTGSELDEDLEKKGDNKVAQPGLASTEEGRKERAHIAAAHREGRDEEGKRESLEKASALHEERTGEPLAELDDDSSKSKKKSSLKKDSSKKSKDSGASDSEGDRKSNKSDDRVAQPGLAETEDGRKERAHIAAAHRKDRDEEGKKESLEKANELHEKRTGEPLEEAEDSSKEAKHHDKKLKSSVKSSDSDKETKSSKKSDDRVAQPGLADTEDGRKERAHIAAAHRKDRDEEGKKESLEKANELHEKRTGESLSEAEESSKDKKSKKSLDSDKHETSHKRHHDEDAESKDDSHKRQKTDDTEEEKPVIAGHVIDQPGLAASADGRRERAFIASAHNKTHSEESQLESLEKANELHEKRTGEPLQEAVERGVAAQ